MSLYEVRIPLVIRKHVPEGEPPPRELGLSIHFYIEAESEADAAAIIRERLCPTVGDP